MCKGDGEWAHVGEVKSSARACVQAASRLPGQASTLKMHTRDEKPSHAVGVPVIAIDVYRSDQILPFGSFLQGFQQV